VKAAQKKRKVVYSITLPCLFLFFLEISAEYLTAKGSRACIKPRCRGKVDSFSMTAGAPLVSELKLKNKVDVKSMPLHANYLWNWAVGKTSVLSFGPELWYSQVGYEIEGVKKDGSSYSGGFALAFSSMSRAKAFIHQIRYTLSVLPYSQLSVKSTSISDISVQESIKSATTQTVLIYQGVAAGISVGMSRFWWVLQYGLFAGVDYQSFQTRSEQSLQKIQGEEATLRSPVSSSVKSSLVTGYIGLLLGMNL